MTKILGKFPIDESDVKNIVSGLKKEEAGQILADGNIDREEIIDALIFDCNGDGKISEADTLSNCIRSNPVLGSVVTILQKYGMELEEKDDRLLMEKADALKMKGRLDEAGSLYKQAFAVTHDKSVKQNSLTSLGACYYMKINEVGTAHEDLPDILKQAQNYTEAAAALLDPDSNDSLTGAIHFNLGQIYYQQYHHLKKTEPQRAEEKLTKAKGQFEMLVEKNPTDIEAKARLESCRAQSRVKAYMDPELMLNFTSNLVKNDSIDEALKAYLISDFIIEKSREVGVPVPEVVNDFLQATVEYRPDRGAEELKTPVQLLKDGFGDCDEWFSFVHSVFGQAGIKHYALIIPKLPGLEIGHIATLYQDGDSKYCVIDNTGIMKFDAKNSEDALKQYAAVWKFGGEGLDWRTMKIEESIDG